MCDRREGNVIYPKVFNSNVRPRGDCMVGEWPKKLGVIVKKRKPKRHRWPKWQRDIAKSLGHDERDIP